MRGETHLDPDLLSAFLEGVLTEHEREACLAHLADCPRCREIAFAAQEPLAVPVGPAPTVAPSPVPWWRRWLAPAMVATGAAAACAIAVAGWMYLHRAPASPAVDEMVAKATPPTPPSRQTSAPRRAAEELAPPYQAVTPVKPRPGAVAAAATSPAPTPPVAAAGVAPPPPAAPPAPARTELDAVGALPDSPGRFLAKQRSAETPVRSGQDSLRFRVDRNGGSGAGVSDVAGSVTDPSGAVIPNANVSMRQLAGTFVRNVQTDVAGNFQAAGLPPGRYEIQIAAPGFQKTSGEVDLQAQDLAMITSKLSIGSTAESVEVSAANSALTLPTELPLNGRNLAMVAIAASPGTTAVRGKLIVKIDSGALSFSKDAGKHWKRVKQPWQGKAVQITTRGASASAPEVFQVTLDSGVVWSSRDGEHWYLDPPSR